MNENTVDKIKTSLTKIWNFMVHPRPIRLPPVFWLILIGFLGLLLLTRTETIIRMVPGEMRERIVILTPTPISDGQLGFYLTPQPSPTPVGSGGTLAFAMRHNGNSDIYLLPQDNGKLLRLTYDEAEDRDPAWSPDGRWLAFASRRGRWGYQGRQSYRSWDLYMMDMTSQTVLRMTNTPGFDGKPTWSPDGRWLAYEHYDDNNLDIYILNVEAVARATQADTSPAADKSQPPEQHRLTYDAAPDYAPAWSPDGRHIAFTSYRDGNKDIYLISLDDGTIVNLTHTPEKDEDHVAWSPDGEYLAYSAGVPGDESIWMLPFEREALASGQLHPILFGTGGEPTWAPDGEALAFIFRQLNTSYLVAESTTGWARAQEGYSTTDWIEKPSWTEATLDAKLVQRLTTRTSEAIARAKEEPAYTELLLSNEKDYYELVTIPEVNGGNEKLSDRVNNSFNAMRRQVEAATGWDYLAILGDSWRPMNHTPRPGQGRISWHVCGRAVDINQGFLRDGRIELVKEEVGGVVFWRVYIRAKAQDGSMGEPLRTAPWSLSARSEGGLATANGGKLKPIPPGYYVDFTMLAADYGWERRNALSNWRTSWYDIEWWHFQKTEGMSWYDCMLELYSAEEISNSYGVLPWWTKRPEWEVESMTW
jgi:TolB protein